MAEGSDVILNDALEAMQHNHSWLLIKNFELTPADYMKELKAHLTRIAAQTDGEAGKIHLSLLGDSHYQLSYNADGDKPATGPCIWITAECCPPNSLDIMEKLQKLSWDTLISIAQGEAENPPDDPLNLSPVTLQNLLSTGKQNLGF